MKEDRGEVGYVFCFGPWERGKLDLAWAEWWLWRWEWGEETTPDQGERSQDNGRSRGSEHGQLPPYLLRLIPGSAGHKRAHVPQQTRQRNGATPDSFWASSTPFCC